MAVWALAKLVSWCEFDRIKRSYISKRVTMLSWRSGRSKPSSGQLTLDAAQSDREKNEMFLSHGSICFKILN